MLHLFPSLTHWVADPFPNRGDPEYPFIHVDPRIRIDGTPTDIEELSDCLDNSGQRLERVCMQAIGLAYSCTFTMA